MKTPLTADKSTSDHTIPELINCGLVSRMPDTLSAVGGRMKTWAACTVSPFKGEGRD